MKQTKATQSSQQTTLKTFFKVKSLKDNKDQVGWSQGSCDSGLVSDLSPVKVKPAPLKSTKKHAKTSSIINFKEKSSKDVKGDKSPLKCTQSISTWLSPVKSPLKDKTRNFSNTNKDCTVRKILDECNEPPETIDLTESPDGELLNTGKISQSWEEGITVESRPQTFKCKEAVTETSRNKSATRVSVLRCSPRKSDKKEIVDSINLCKSDDVAIGRSISPQKYYNQTITCSISPEKSRNKQVVHRISPQKYCKKKTDNRSQKPDNQEVPPRRSPRKHQSSSRSVKEDEIKESSQSTLNAVRTVSPILIDETDDAFFEDFSSPVESVEVQNSKRCRGDDNISPLREIKKLKSRLLQVSPKPQQHCDESFDHFFSQDLQFSQEKLDPISHDDVDLSEGCRCKVTEVTSTPQGSLHLKLLSLHSNLSTRCILHYPWNELGVREGDLVSVKAARDGEWEWSVSDKPDTWLVLHSDVLISCTTVVGSMFCHRRSVINHMFKEVPSKSQASLMYVGIVVHQLLQQALKNNLSSSCEIERLYQEIVSSRDFVRTAYLQGMDIEHIKQSTSDYLPRIVEFIKSYVSVGATTKPCRKREWDGEITEVHDIEENIWLPELGLKGKIDATVQVRHHSEHKIMPLELKTGKASNSAEHRGQVILYCLMLSQIGAGNVDSGLLLYLKDGSLKEVAGGDKERRHLIMLRNELSSRIHKAQATSQTHGVPSLPSPIDRRSVCLTCPQLIPCTATLRQSGDSSSPLSDLVAQKTSHLSNKHLDYVFSWLRLISLEIGQGKQLSPIWADTVFTREEEGRCLSGLTVHGEVKAHQLKQQVTFTCRNSPIRQGILEEGQYVVVSSDSQVAIGCGHVQSISSTHVTLLLDRDLSKMDGPFHVDRYESNSSSSMLSSFLSVLFDNTPRADKLRRLIVDLELPKFASKLSSKIKIKCEKVFSSINRDQVRAILQVLSADSFIIIKGMPGTGKSKTVAGLIEVLTVLGHSVLLTSHTHSAIDNILLRLPHSLHDRILRLGPARRVHPHLSHLTETYLLEHLSKTSYQDIASFYTSKTIVGVTCLGATHQLIVQRNFDYCLVDEATQVCQPETLAALSFCNKFVLIGDPHQLPPLVISEKAKELGMGVSLLERLDRPAVTTSLTLQYRMNQTITALANSFSYSNQLKCADQAVAQATVTYLNQFEVTTADWLCKICCPDLSESVVVIDVSLEDMICQNINKKEADIVISIVTTMRKAGVSDSDIGIISPYRAQVSLIESLINAEGNRCNIEVSTVDQFQGRDKSVIVYSGTRNKPWVAGAGHSDILSDKNRLTVAITRAKHKLIIVGNTDTLSSYPTFKSLFSCIHPSHFIKVPST